tara:strand:- start:31 stop:348 length:318 start_codon:yes stop_codon:yes gene_type:complete
MRIKREHITQVKQGLKNCLYVLACLIFLTACVLPQATANSGIPFYELNENGEKQVKLGQEEYDIDGNGLVTPFRAVEEGQSQLLRQCFFRSEFLGDVPNPPPEYF